MAVLILAVPSVQALEGVALLTVLLVESAAMLNEARLSAIEALRHQ